ncbi:MAG: response regulator [Ignavibacteriaceae bacterium]
MRFLIVDDNDAFRAYLKQLVTNANDQCIELHDGLCVNSVYKVFKPDWVLLDIMMKEVNGLKAAENLVKEFPDARFAIISGYSDDIFRKRAEELGAEAFISKDNLFDLIGIIHPGTTKDKVTGDS